MDSSKIKGNVNGDAPVKSTRIRVGRSIEGFGLSPGITKEQRLEVIISKYVSVNISDESEPSWLELKDFRLGS